MRQFRCEPINSGGAALKSNSLEVVDAPLTTFAFMASFDPRSLSSSNSP
jgi:hypothetical protein